MSAESCLCITDLNKYFGSVHILKNINLTVSEGTCTGLLGHNGAGKSTLIKIIVGVLPYSTGTLLVHGKNYNDNSYNNADIRKNIGYLPELPTLYPELRVLDFLKFVAVVKKVHPWRVEVDRVVQSCSLGGVVSKRMGDISKGFKQRVGLAQSLIGSPKMLVLDEVTSGLDPNQRLQMIDLLKKHTAAKKTIIFSSHSIEDTLTIADSIVFLSDGKIMKEFVCPPDEEGKLQLRNEIMKGFVI